MTTNLNTESGYRFIDLFLMQAEFKRLPNVNFDSDQILKEHKIETSSETDENRIAVTETFNYKQILEGVLEVEANIVMVGIFEQYGEPNLSMQEFGRINGPAIIFPFIREQFSNLTSKAGLGLFLLQPVNFERINKIQAD